MPWRREWPPTPVFLPGEFHGQGNLTGYNPQGHRVGHDWATNAFIFMDTEDTYKNQWVRILQILIGPSPMESLQKTFLECSMWHCVRPDWPHRTYYAIIGNNDHYPRILQTLCRWSKIWSLQIHHEIADLTNMWNGFSFVQSQHFVISTDIRQTDSWETWLPLQEWLLLSMWILPEVGTVSSRSSPVAFPIPGGESASPEKRGFCSSSMEEMKDEDLLFFSSKCFLELW